ncbi:hypothetical protein B0F89_11913 [Malaciobacter marinus]|jgi:5-methylcytosine-specific restriction protein B|uniref:HTH-like domain-containing protein n=1 Tax=Malaciobacter marinus TaxID=505249 RepID=A0AB36ZWA5_9BACT|nr:hypothetical protein [Malaciobacter marinus]PPK60560.1 hypothetical protein B0F89_11913 [Malaciobacter marinus]
MSEEELVDKLKSMYDNAANRKQVASIHLFGIKYADELKNKNLKEIAKKATGKSSYFSEINKGMSLKPLLEESSLLKINPVTVNNKNLKIKNIMLYGAPGVGKTYNYKRLISLIEEGKSESEIFNIIKEKDDYAVDESIYKNIKKDKRVEFVSFH